MKKADTTIVVGKIGATYGVQGWLKIHAYTEFSISLLDYSPWLLIDKDNKIVTIELENGRAHGKGIIAKLEGINTKEDAQLLTGRKIAIFNSQLPKLKQNEYYWSDLVDLIVINKNGDILGKVIYLMETGANDVLVVKGTKEHAIPYLPGKVIMRIDLEKQEIHVDWEVI